MSRMDESVLASLANALSDSGGYVGMGNHAALRRMNPLAPGVAAAVVYRLLAEQEVSLDDDARLLRWCVLVHALALARGAHNKGIPIGKGLWAMNYTERRINQLLFADFDGLAQLVPRLARRLRSSGGALDFAPLMRLVLTADINPEAADKARLDIARSCAREQPKD